MKPQEIESILEILAAKFGTTVEHLWEVMVRQSILIGSIELGVIFVWIILAVIALHYIKRKTHGERSEWCDEKKEIAWGILCLFITLATIISGVCISGIISGIVNPEYWALQKLLP